MRLILLTLLLILSAGPACAPLAPAGIAMSPATGIEGAFSRQAIIAGRGHDVMVGRVLVLRQSGRTALTAEVGQLRRSGQRRLVMNSAWIEGARYAFRGATRSEPYCTGGGNCQGYRTGAFHLTRAAFERATQDGLRATLIGPDAAVEIRFPADLFAEARDRARARGLWPP